MKRRSSIEVNADDAKLAAYTIEYTVIAYQRASVRGGGAGGDFGQADLQHHDRLGGGDGASGGRSKAWSVADGFGEQGDRADFGLIDQVFDEGCAVQIGFVAGGNHVRQADLVLRGETGDEAAVGAALRDDGNAAGFAGGTESAGPERHVVDEVDEAKAVGAEQRHVVLTCECGQVGLQLRAVLAGFGKS